MDKSAYSTAPYLQYAYTRIMSLYRKAEEKYGRDITDLHRHIDAIALDNAWERDLALRVIRYPEVLEEVIAAGLPNQLCQYTYELSAAYMSFYEQCPILRDDVPRPTMKSRLLLSYLTAKTLKSALALLGIQTTARM